MSAELWECSHFSTGWLTLAVGSTLGGGQQLQKWLAQTTKEEILILIKKVGTESKAQVVGSKEVQPSAKVQSSN